MYIPPYTYRGRPIGSSNRRSYRPYRRPSGGGWRGKLWKFFLLLLLVAAVGGAIYAVWHIAASLTSKGTSETDENIVSSEGNAGNGNSDKGTPSEFDEPYYAWRQTYGMARELYEAKQFDRAYEVLIPLFENVPASEKVYADGQNLLFNISTELDRTRTKATETFLNHKVARGEALSIIARKYNTSVQDIKQLNELVSDSIRINQVLKIRKLDTPATDMSVRISSGSGKIFLYTEGKLWKIYDVESGVAASLKNGRFTVLRKDNAPQDRSYGRKAIELSINEYSPSAAVIHGTGPAGSRLGADSFRLSNDDIADLADSISTGTVVELGQ